MKLSNATSEIVKANREKSEKEQAIVALRMTIEELRKEIICLQEKNERIVAANWRKCSDYQDQNMNISILEKKNY